MTITHPLDNMKLKLKNIAALAAGIITTAAMTSCFEQDNNTKLSKDGSGTIVESTIVGAQFAQMMKGQMEQGGQNDMTDEGKYRDKVKRMGEGVEFVGLETKDADDGGLVITATYKFADISKLKGPMSDDESAAPVTFDYEKGDTNKLTINLPQAPKAAEGAKDGEGEEAAEEELTDEMKAAQKQQMQMMAGMAQGMKISMTLEVDGEIVKTDADHVEGNKVTLMAMDIGAILANEEALDMLDSPDDMNDVSTLRELASKIEGLKIEGDEKIVVEFK